MIPASKQSLPERLRAYADWNRRHCPIAGATTAHCECQALIIDVLGAADEIERQQAERQRLFDLVRQMRMELFTADLIDQDELWRIDVSNDKTTTTQMHLRKIHLPHMPSPSIHA